MGVLKLVSFQVWPVARVFRLIMILAGCAGSYSPVGSPRASNASPAPRKSSWRFVRGGFLPSTVRRPPVDCVRSICFDAVNESCFVVFILGISPAVVGVATLSVTLQLFPRLFLVQFAGGAENLGAVPWGALRLWWSSLGTLMLFPVGSAITCLSHRAKLV